MVGVFAERVIEHVAHTGVISERGYQGLVHIVRSAPVQLAGNLVEVAADLAKMPEHQPQRLRVRRNAALGARPRAVQCCGAQESGGGHSGLVGAVEEQGIFGIGQAGLRQPGALTLLRLAPPGSGRNVVGQAHLLSAGRVSGGGLNAGGMKPRPRTAQWPLHCRHRGEYPVAGVGRE